MEPAAKWLLFGVFLVVIGGVFLADLLQPYGPRDAVRVFGERSRPLQTNPGVMESIMAWNRENLADIEALEAQVEDESILRVTIPYYQWFFVRVLGTSGTGRVLIGRDDWYFLKEGLEASLGWGDRENLRHADGAVRRLAGMLSEHGVRLIMVPVPGKADAMPGKFSSRFEAGKVLGPDRRREQVYRNWDALPGVSVIPTAEIFAESIGGGGVPFLIRDTHWTPDAMHAVAMRIAAVLQDGESIDWVPGGDPQLVTGEGDLVEMMRLPERITPPQTVEVERFSADRIPGGEAEVVFLGDSFAAIFSDENLGWGTGAGLRDLLPVLIGEPVDFRLNYGDPVSGPGRQLQRLLNAAEQEGRPRVIVWQFAERFLDQGTWDELFREE